MSYQTDLIHTMLLLGAITADYSSCATSVCAESTLITENVEAWSPESDPADLLVIEADLTELAASLKTMAASTCGVSSVDVDSDITMSVVTSVVNLLNALYRRADEFKSAGASGAVAHALELMQAPSQSIVGELVAAVSNSPKGTELRPYLTTLQAAVNSVNPAYGISSVHFPTLLV